MFPKTTFLVPSLKLGAYRNLKTLFFVLCQSDLVLQSNPYIFGLTHQLFVLNPLN
jgi:hypothetical protein